MPSFFGSFEHSLDPKNRLFIPPAFRALLAREGENHFMLAAGPEKCLYLFLPSQWESLLSDGMAAFRGKDKEEARAFRRFFFSAASSARPDKAGRILIGQNHKNHAGLRKEAAIIGAGNKAEIWDLKRWKAYQKKAIAPRGKKFARVYDI